MNNENDVPKGFRFTPKQQIVWDWASSHGLTLLADDCNDLLWKLLLHEDDGWKSMDSAPLDRLIELRAWIIPSDTARNNGAQAFWDECSGRWSGFTWTGIMNGKPDMWREIKPR